MNSDYTTPKPMAITLPREERYKNPAPQRVDHRYLQTLKEVGCRNSHIAVEIQLLAHQLLSNPTYYEVLKRWPRTNMQRIRGMAFESYYPQQEDLDGLNHSLRGKKGSVHDEVRNFKKKVEDLIETDEEYWNSTRWKNDQRAMHQDVDAVNTLVKNHYGRLAFFGSARLNQGSPEYDGARWLSRVLVEELGNPDGTTEEVVTGGGPGIMEAGNRGALEGSWNYIMKMIDETGKGKKDKEEVELAILNHRSRLQSIGVRIELPFETGWNDHLQLNLSLPKFPARKEALITLASGEFGPNQTMPDYQNRHPAYFIFKGGIGTKDEGWEVVCLIQCGKLPPTPVFIVGEEERRAFDKTMQSMLEQGTISAQDPHLRIGNKDHLIYCKDEKEAAKKYVEWYGLNPPSSFEKKLKNRTPSIKAVKDESEPVADDDSEGRIKISA